MINIVTNTQKQITFEKTNREESWFDCSDSNLLKECNRQGETIERIKFDDGKHIASLLHVYFK